jgi:hypothetical protein
MGPEQSEMEHEGHCHLGLSSVLGKSACFVLDTSEANLVGDKSLWLMAYCWSNDTPIYFRPNTIGYTPYALFFGREMKKRSPAQIGSFVYSNSHLC